MLEHLPLAIGIGLVVSLIFSELFHLAPGGMVVPGYMALFLDKPLSIAVTCLAGIVTFVILRLLSSVMIIYGRRRTVIAILVGYLVGMGFQIIFAAQGMALFADLEVIGYIIPGLIAIWLDRQGLVETVSTMLVISSVVRLLMFIIIGEDLLS